MKGHTWRQAATDQQLRDELTRACLEYTAAYDQAPSAEDERELLVDLANRIRPLARHLAGRARGRWVSPSQPGDWWTDAEAEDGRTPSDAYRIEEAR